VVLGLILIAPPLLRVLARPFAPDPFLPRDLLTSAQKFEEKFWYGVCAVLATSVAATIVSEPITAIDFHQVTPISILANLIVVPMAGLITVIGTTSVAVSFLSTTLAGMINNSNWLLGWILIALVGWFAHEPGASINVPDLRAFATPKPSFIVAPLQDSACLLVRTENGAWLINAGRDAVARASTSHLLQFYGVNRLDGLVLAQLSGPDNGGASVIIRDFRPTRLVVPVLGTRSPLEKTLPDLVALAGRETEAWQRGQVFALGSGVSVRVLHPASDSPESHAEDRALALLFQAAGRTLLWAGKMGPETQADLVTSYPDLRADVLVMGTEPPPGEGWLASLGVRDWLQIPPRDRQVNATQPVAVPDACRVWPLDETGAVALDFQAPQTGKPGQIHLRPWVKPPPN
jgi:beta-lactamase superfamily II metal-dependent hydrolase